MSQTTVLIFPFLEISKEISLYVSKEKNGSLLNIFSKAEKSDVLCLTEIKDVLPQAEYHIPLYRTQCRRYAYREYTGGNTQKYKQLFTLQGKTISVCIFNFLLIYKR